MRLGWRCKNIQQQRDKAEIYNSREWQQLRALKLEANPLCERCAEKGFVRSAHCVHHIEPIETAATKAEMWRLAIGCGLKGLMSLCDQCHADIHREARSHSRETHQQCEEARLQRWLERRKRPTS